MSLWRRAFALQPPVAGGFGYTPGGPDPLPLYPFTLNRTSGAGTAHSASPRPLIFLMFFSRLFSRTSSSAWHLRLLPFYGQRPAEWLPLTASSRTPSSRCTQQPAYRCYCFSLA